MMDGWDREELLLDEPRKDDPDELDEDTDEDDDDDDLDDDFEDDDLEDDDEEEDDDDWDDDDDDDDDDDEDDVDDYPRRRMRGLIQRVTEARVEVDREVVGAIGRGLLVLIGVARDDSEDDASWLASKVAELRIFEDRAGKMNDSVEDVSGEVLAVSQFTLLAETSHGRRPSFSQAADPEDAERLYLRCVWELRARGLPVATGHFGSSMQVSLTNDGPVTIWLDSREA